MPSCPNLAAVLATALLAACGGSTRSQAQATTLSAGPHTLALTLSVPPGLATPVSGLALSLRLPPGVTVATSDPATGEVASTSLAAGSAVTGVTVVQGAWAPSTRDLRLLLATTPAGPWSGQYLRLGLVVLPGAAVTAADLLAIGDTLPDYRAVGVDATTRSTVMLTAQARTTLQVLP